MSDGASGKSVSHSPGTLRLGFLPQIEAAPLLAAQELGYFADEGLRVQLLRHVSWAALRDGLMGEEDNTSLSLQELDLKHGLIQRILDDDAEIRRHTEPWMEQVRRFLGGRSTRERVERSYGSGS